MAGIGNYKHGHARAHNESSTYSCWKNMVRRCSSPKASKGIYVKRGITVCKRWLKFENFLADMGDRPKGKSIDRINNNGNYEPKNCRWATAAEQRQNTRTSKRWTIAGKVYKSLNEAEKKTGISRSLIQWRVRVKWDGYFKRYLYKQD